MHLAMRSILRMAAAVSAVQAIPRPSLISHLVLDFDETLTTHDTIANLTDAAYALQAQRNPPPSIQPWSFFTDAYMADYTAHTVGRPSSNRTTVGQELDFLASLLPVERASIERIEAGGVFAGILEAELAEAAATRVELRSGWFRDVVRPALKSGAKVSILSVNWSAGWIREALKAGAVREGGDAQNLDKLEILSNDLVVDDEGITTGKLTRWFEERNEGIWTAKEKKLVLDQLVGCEEGSPGRVTVYVGDSSTDLEAALAADVGIYIGDKQVAMTARVGIDLVTVPNIRAFLGRKKNAKKPMLVKVSSMEELGKFLGLGRN